jgi:GDP-mannose 6-dehydrogenase
VCVGTPSLRSGKLDLSHLEHVAREILAALKEKQSHHVIVVRSTVLPGTTESLIIPILQSASGRRAGADFAVCYSPEFMRDTAIADFLEPPYTILGAQSPQHLALPRTLCESTPSLKFETSVAVAEMVKYASNMFHAVKVVFANEVGTLCKGLDVDTESGPIFLPQTRN